MSPSRRPRGCFSLRVIVAATNACVAFGSSGTSRSAFARRASGSRPLQSSSTSEPRRRSRMPALRRRRKRAKRARLGRDVQRRAERVHGLLERRARVRRAEGHGQAHLLRPIAAVMARGAGDEAAHRMPDQRDPLRVEAFEQLRQQDAVLRDVAAAVVADVDRRHAEIARQPVAVARRPPRVLGLAEPVHEDRDVRRRRAVPAELHRDRERAALGLEPVAVEPVQRRDRHRPARRLGERDVADPAPGGGADGARGEPHAAADALVGPAGDRIVDQPDRRGRRPEDPEHAPGDRGVDVTDPARERGQLRPRPGG